MFGHFVSDILGLSNAHTSMVAAFALRTFHVKRWRSYRPNISPNIYIRAVHHLQPGATFEGDEPAGELFCRIMINRVNFPTEILSIEFADLVDVFYPDGDMLDFHNQSLKFREAFSQGTYNRTT